jgi:hypothetical protein
LSLPFLGFRSGAQQPVETQQDVLHPKKLLLPLILLPLVEALELECQLAQELIGLGQLLLERRNIFLVLFDVAHQEQRLPNDISELFEHGEG